MLPLLHLSSLSGAHKHQENHRSVQGLHCLQATLSFLPMRVAWSCVTFDALNLEPGRDRLLLGKGRGGVRLLCGVSGLKKYTGNLQVPDRSTTVDVNTHNYNVHHGIPPQTYVHPGYRCALHRVAPGIRHSSYNQTSKRCTTAPHHIKYTLYTLQTLQQHTTAPNRHDTLSSTHISFPWSFLPLLPLPAHQSVFLFLHTPSLFASPSLSLSLLSFSSLLSFQVLPVLPGRTCCKWIKPCSLCQRHSMGKPAAAAGTQRMPTPRIRKRVVNPTPMQPGT